MQIKKNNFNNLLLVSIMLLILTKTIFYNHILKIVHSPDYGYHLTLIKGYSKQPNIFLIDKINQIAPMCSNIYKVSPITTQPNLYASITGKIYFLLSKIKNIDTARYTNLVQTIFGLLTILYTYKLAFIVFKNKTPRLFTVLILSSIQMFSYIINFLSYDNLTNLLSIISIYYSIIFYKNKNVVPLLYTIIAILLASLTKISTGPLILLILLPLAFIILKYKNDIILNFKSFLSNNMSKLLLLSSIIILLLYENINFYGKNILKYKSLTGSKMRTVELSYCKNLNNINQDKIIKKEESERKNERISLLNYSIIWEKTIEERIFNITSHKSLNKPKNITFIYHYILIISLILFLLNLKSIKKEIIILLYYSMGYLLFLLLMVNYNSYLNTGSINKALQGRYIFPVIGPMVILFVYSFWIIPFKKSKIPNIAILSLISIFFLYGDNYFLFTKYKEWSLPLPSLSHELGNTDPINKNENSPFQKVSLTNKNLGIAIYTSTFTKKIEPKSFNLNLYKNDCITKIKSKTLKSVKDNAYAFISFDRPFNGEYCFNISNSNSTNPITLWYSKKNLQGNIFYDNKDKLNQDLVYSLLDENGISVLDQWKNPFSQ